MCICLVGLGLVLGLRFHLFSFVCLHVRAVKTPTSVRICAGSSEPSLLVSAISVKILWTGLNDYNGRDFLHSDGWGQKPPPCSWKQRPHDYICHRLWNTQLWCKFFFLPPPFPPPPSFQNRVIIEKEVNHKIWIPFLQSMASSFVSC